MGILNKIMFWKKKDDFGDLGLGLEGEVGKEPELGLEKDVTGLGGAGTGGTTPGARKEMPGFGSEEHVFGAENPLAASQGAPLTPEIPGAAPHPSAMPPPPSPPSSAAPESSYIVSKELEIISTKLDALRAGIDSISHRLGALERIARGDHERSW